MSINLLPPNIKPRHSVVVVGKMLKKLVFLLVIILLVLSSVLTATFLSTSKQLSDAEKEKKELVSSVKALEQTEQRLILVKDRLSKISRLLEQESVKEEVETLKKITEIAGDGLLISNVELSSDAASVTFSTGKSSNLVNFLDHLRSLADYQKIEVVSLNYNQQSGFIMRVKLVS